MTSAYDFSFRDLDGQPQALARYQGHPLLLVNVASRCGFTRSTPGWNSCGRTTANAAWW